MNPDRKPRTPNRNPDRRPRELTGDLRELDWHCEDVEATRADVLLGYARYVGEPMLIDSDTGEVLS